jgi:hypothetical protein
MVAKDYLARVKESEGRNLLAFAPMPAVAPCGMLKIAALESANLQQTQFRHRQVRPCRSAMEVSCAFQDDE